MSNITTYQKRSTPYWLNFIYAGQMYSWTYRITVNSLAYGYIILKTPTDKITHMLTRDYSLFGGDMMIKFYEGAVYSDGTLRPSYNLNRPSSKTAGTLFYSTPTMTSNGTLIDQIYLGDTASYSYPALFSSGLCEIVLKSNTNYVFEFYNNSVTMTNIIQFLILFYESSN